MTHESEFLWQQNISKENTFIQGAFQTNLKPENWATGAPKFYSAPFKP